MTSETSILSKYHQKVKISNWQDPYLAEPFDNENPKNNESHYRSFGIINETCNTPKTTTKEMLSSGLTNPVLSKCSTKKLLTNFDNHPLVEKYSKNAASNDSTISRRKYCSTYQWNFARHKNENPSSLPDKTCEKETLFPLLNRIAKNDFLLASHVAPFKFMDDHFYQISPQKQCANLLKRTRLISYIPWLGTYQSTN